MTRRILTLLVGAALLLTGGLSAASAWHDLKPDNRDVTGGTEASTASAPQTMWLARNVANVNGTTAFDAASRRARFILPKGLRSADGKQYWSTFQTGDATAVHSFDLTDGTILETLGLEGDWEMGAVSATGKWIALKRAASESERAEWTKANTWGTTVKVVDTETLQTTRTIELDGNFDVDALDAKGTALYLIQHLPAIKPDHYQVRLYDLALGQFQAGAIVDKRNVDEVMAGYGWDSVASPDGQWLFTLYVGMQEKHAFIHALNVQERYAWCIDLPSGGGDEATLEHYALAVAPDGHTVYASNAALGILATADVMDIGEPHVMRFSPGFDATKETESPLRSSIVSVDGKQVFMSDAGAVWQYDVATSRAQELDRSTMPIIGLAMDSSGNIMLAAHADHSVSAIALESAPANSQATSFAGGQNKNGCTITQSPAQPFVPPAPYPSKPTFGGFWYGTENLWTALRPDGTWEGLPHNEGGYTQKLVWWRKGYVGTAEPEPAIKVTGRRLDAEAPPLLASSGSNAYSVDFGGWAMMVGVDVPTLGCWELTGKYGDETLSFVVQVLE